MNSYSIIREVFGLVAVVLIIAACATTYSRRGRVMNFFGAILLITYGVLIHSHIIVIMSFSLTIIHMYRAFKGPGLSPGCIVIGYQGIGKTTLSLKNSKYIDLESGMFYVDNKRDPNWYQIYCNIAIELAAQGYIVFTSSHLEVREYLTTIPMPSSIKVFTCYPCHELKDTWTQKLANRYHKSDSSKDYRAWMNAVHDFDDNISDIEACDAIKIPITDINYDLDVVISKAIRQSK